MQNAPARTVPGVTTANRLANILQDIQGIGCRIEKPTDRDGLGWHIVVDGYSTDIDSPDGSILPSGGAPTTVVVSASASPVTNSGSPHVIETQWDLDTVVVETNDNILEADAATNGWVIAKEGYAGLYEIKMTIRNEIEPTKDGTFYGQSRVKVGGSTVLEWEVSYEETTFSGSPLLKNEHSVSKIVFIDSSEGDVFIKAYYQLAAAGAGATLAGTTTHSIDNLSVSLIHLTTDPTP